MIARAISGILLLVTVDIWVLSDWRTAAEMMGSLLVTAAILGGAIRLAMYMAGVMQRALVWAFMRWGGRV